MEIYQILIMVAGGLGAIGGIWKAVAPVIKAIASVAEIKDIVIRNRLGILRLELLRTIQHEPERVETIENMYREYKGIGGNGYVDVVVEKWRDTHEGTVLERRLWGQK